VDHAYIASWFKYAPVSVQAPKKAPRMVSRSQAAKVPRGGDGFRLMGWRIVSLAM
jgi:hypothetical protein